MAQATLDEAVLDAAGQSPSGFEAAGNTDDMLSRMAGDEIDRLLADSDSDALPAAPPVSVAKAKSPPPTAAAATVVVEDPDLAAELDSLIATEESKNHPPDPIPAPAAKEILPSPPAPPAAAIPTAPAATLEDNDLAAELDSLIIAEKSEIPAEPALASKSAEDAEKAEKAEEARLKVLAEELEVDEPKAPAAPVAASLPRVAAPAPPRSGDPFIAYTGPLAWLQQLLIWINAPLDQCPQIIRAVIGPAAVVTFFNAVGLLVYVAVRKHH